MTVRDELKSNFSTAVNTEGEIFQALVTNPDNTGVIESELNTSKEYMDSWTDTPSIYDQTDEQFDKSVNFFVHLKQLTEETLEDYKNRIAALFIRAAPVLGTVYDVEETFRKYTQNDGVFVAENCQPFADSIIQDGDFEGTNPNWTTFLAELSKTARVSKTYGYEINSDQSYIKRILDVSDWEDGIYYIHFFVKGDIGILLYDETNKLYWNSLTDSWQEESVKNLKSGKGVWEAKSMYFKKTSDMTNLDLYFYGSLFTEEDFEQSIVTTFEQDNIDFTDPSEWDDPPGETDPSYETSNIDFITEWDDPQPKDTDPAYEKSDLDFDLDWNNYGYIDYVRIFKKQSYPNFVVIIQTISRPNYAKLIADEGTSDPEPYGSEAQKHSYYNGVYVGNQESQYISSLYKDLLPYVSAQGVSSGIEMIYKDFIQ